MKKILFLTLVATILITACTIKEDEKQWVQINPIQCLGNSWEIDWLSFDDNEYSDYPRNKQEEIKIIKDYYQKQGIKIFNAKLENTFKDVCLACHCPRGDTLYLLVSVSDVDEMLGFGYLLSD